MSANASPLVLEGESYTRFHDMYIRRHNRTESRMRVGGSLILVPSTVLDTTNLGGVAILGNLSKLLHPLQSHTLDGGCKIVKEAL